MSDLLEELVEDSRWPVTFDNFMRHLRSRILLGWIKDRSHAPPPPDEVAVWRRCYVYRGEVPTVLAFDYRGILRALVECRLHADAIRVRYQRGDGEELDLADHLSSLVYGQLVMHSGSLQHRVRNADAAIRLFESGSDDYLATIDKALHSLSGLLIKRSRQWQ